MIEIARVRGVEEFDSAAFIPRSSTSIVAWARGESDRAMWSTPVAAWRVWVGRGGPMHRTALSIVIVTLDVEKVEFYKSTSTGASREVSPGDWVF